MTPAKEKGPAARDGALSRRLPEAAAPVQPEQPPGGGNRRNESPDRCRNLGQRELVAITVAEVGAVEEAGAITSGAPDGGVHLGQELR